MRTVPRFRPIVVAVRFVVATIVSFIVGCTATHQAETAPSPALEPPGPRQVDAHETARAPTEAESLTLMARSDLDSARTPHLRMPDRSLEATIVSVGRSTGETTAEIRVGSRDGVKKGWVLTIGRNGVFVGTLRLIAVEADRSIGVVELEDPATRGPVVIGDRVYARSSN